MKKYSRIISVMADSIKILFRMDKPYLGFLFSSMVIMALIPFVNANLVSEVINLAVSEQNGKKAVLAACTLLGILTVPQKLLGPHASATPPSSGFPLFHNAY